MKTKKKMILYITADGENSLPQENKNQKLFLLGILFSVPILSRLGNNLFLFLLLRQSDLAIKNSQ